MSLSSGTVLKGLIAQLSQLIQRRPIPKDRHYNKQNHQSSYKHPESNLSKQDLEYIVQETTRRILEVLNQNPETRQQKEGLSNKCVSTQGSLEADVSFCSPEETKNRRERRGRNQNVERIVSIQRIRNKADRLVSRIKDIA